MSTQNAILDFLRDYTAAHGFPPSVREIGDHLGIASTSSVHSRLRDLERDGLIHREPGRARAITVPDGAAA